MGDPVSHGIGLPRTRAGDDQERSARCSVFPLNAILDRSSLFTIESLEHERVCGWAFLSL
jgi:hypothetical protein